jgi:hypothetical protein
MADYTGGVFNSKNLLEGNNFLCFAMQAASAGKVDALSSLTSSLTNALSSLGCPELSSVNKSALSQFPGAQDS